MSTIKINSMSYTGNNVAVINGKVYINGREVVSEDKQISITVQGDIEFVQVDYCQSIVINGTVGEVDNGSGDVRCGPIGGHVRSGSGNVNCDDIQGDVTTGSGNIKANNIYGKIKTGSGNVKYGGQ